MEQLTPIISVIVTVLAYIAYARKRYDWMLISFVFLLTGGYMLLPTAEHSVKPQDLLTLVLIIITVVEMSKARHYLRLKGDDFARLVVILLCYHVFEYIVTVMTGAEGMTNALKVMRVNALYLLYFLYRKMPADAVRSFFFINMKIAIAMGILFYLQVVGVEGILQGRVDEAESASDQVRYMNAPFMYSTYFIYAVIAPRQSIAARVAGIIFWGGMLVLGMTRSSFLTIGLVIVIYLIIKQSFRLAATLAVLAVAAYFVVLPVFQYRDSQGHGTSTVEDIQLVLRGGDAVTMGESGGTFSFRIGMLLERFDYLVENPEYLLTGVGDIHEDSPNCYRRFNFTLGTVNAGRTYGHCIIESGDIAWVPLLLRYGLIGIFLYVWAYVIWFRRGFRFVRRETDIIFVIFALTVVSNFLGSFIGAGFTTANGLFSFVLYLAYLRTRNIEMGRKAF